MIKYPSCTGKGVGDSYPSLTFDNPSAYRSKRQRCEHRRNIVEMECSTHVVRLSVAVIARETLLVVGHVKATIGGALHAAEDAVTANRNKRVERYQ